MVGKLGPRNEGLLAAEGPRAARPPRIRSRRRRARPPPATAGTAPRRGRRARCAARIPAISTGFLTARGCTTGSVRSTTSAPAPSSASAIHAGVAWGSTPTRAPRAPRAARVPRTASGPASATPLPRWRATSSSTRARLREKRGGAVGGEHRGGAGDGGVGEVRAPQVEKPRDPNRGPRSRRPRGRRRGGGAASASRFSAPGWPAASIPWATILPAGAGGRSRQQRSTGPASREAREPPAFSAARRRGAGAGDAHEPGIESPSVSPAAEVLPDPGFRRGVRQRCAPRRGPDPPRRRPGGCSARPRTARARSRSTTAVPAEPVNPVSQARRSAWGGTNSPRCSSSWGWT